MTAEQATPVATEGGPRVPRTLGWVLALMLGLHFLQWTVVLPADVRGALGFVRSDLDTGRWWTALTYPFAHPDTSLLLLNGYALAIFGTRLERSLGSGRFFVFLLLAALGGWVLHLFIGGNGPLLGASSLAFGVLGAHGLRWGHEDQPLAGGFRARVRWTLFLVASLILLVGLQAGVGGGVGFLAHLGGMGAAWLFVRTAPVLLVERFREGVSTLPDDPPEDQPPRAIPKTLPRSRARDRETIDDVVARTNAPPARRAPTKRRVEPKAPPSAPPSIDAILDKIASEGIEQLTDEERSALEDHSRRLRGR